MIRLRYPQTLFVIFSAALFLTLFKSYLAFAEIQIDPANVTVSSGGTVQFSASETVIWTLEANPGVDVGSISVVGLYTAPAQVPPDGRVRVYAESIITGVRESATVVVSSTTADGSFIEIMSLPALDSSIPQNFYMVDDISGDGVADFWNLGTHLGLEGLSYYTGQGDGTFGSYQLFYSYDLPRDPAYASTDAKVGRIAELDGDGIPDLVVLSDSDHSGAGSSWLDVGIAYHGRGDGTFTLIAEFFRDDFLNGLDPYKLWAPVLEDFDGDGLVDVAMVDRDDAVLYVSDNDGSGQFVDRRAYGTDGINPYVLHSGDVNNDGHMDLVVINLGDAGANGSNVKVFLNDGFGAFIGQPVIEDLQVIDPANTARVHETSALGDVDNDGVLDLLVRVDEWGTGSSDAVLLLKGAGDGTFDPPVVLGFTMPPFFNYSMVLTLGHTDADGNVDALLAFQPTSGDSVYVIQRWAGDGSGSFSYAGDLWQTERPILSVEVTELNGDDRYDLVVARAADVGAYGRVVGTLLGGPGVGVTPAIVLYPDAQGVMNIGESSSHTLTLGSTQHGTLEPEVVWYVNGIAWGDETVGTIAVVDDYRVVYTPPEASTLAEVTIEVQSADGTLSVSVPVEFAYYRWYLVSDNSLTDPDVRKLVWAADGSRLYAATDTEVFVSTDDGQSWAAASGSGSSELPGTSIYSLLVDPDDALTVYAGVERGYAQSPEDEDYLNHGGVYKSTDGGQSWMAVNNGLELVSVGGTLYPLVNVAYLAISEPIPGGGRTLLAAVEVDNYDEYNGVYRSDDSGASWTKLAGLTGLVNSIATDPVDPDTWYTSIYTESVGGPQLLKSTDGGQTWTDIGANLPQLEPDTYLSAAFIAVDPFDAQHLMVQGRIIIHPLWAIVESWDGGLTWQRTQGYEGVQGFPKFSPADQGTVLTTKTYLSTSLSVAHWYLIRAGLKLGATALSPVDVAIAPAGAANPGAFYAATNSGVFADFPVAGPPPCEDLFSFAQAFGTTNSDSNYNISCDSEPDGDIDGVDLSYFLQGYGL